MIGIIKEMMPKVETLDVASALSTSLSAWNSAAAGSWVLITQSEYNALSSLAGVGAYGATNGGSSTVSGNITLVGRNYVTLIPSGQFPFAARTRNSENSTNAIKIGDGSYTNLVQLGSTYSAVGHWSGNTYCYVLLKGATYKTVNSAYTGMYFSNQIFCYVGGGSICSYGSGNTNYVGDTFSPIPDLQVLATTRQPV